MPRFLLLLLLTLAARALSAQVNDTSFTLFLLGDGGEPDIKDSPLGSVLSRRVANAGSNSMVLFLGDNVYPEGLPPKGSRHYESAELPLRTQVDFLNGLDTRGIFIPGNHDWQHWGRRGLEYVIRQQRWLDSLKDERIRQLPRNGCPGPVELPLDEKNLLVILDTQWLLHQWDKPRDADLCVGATTAEVLLAVEDIFRRNSGKRIILAAHHPLITYGEHGGVYPWQSHLFPLRDLNEHLYIPMPVIGSIYPLYRKYLGHLQDTPHPLYKEFANALRDIMSRYPGTFYIAGHEHALQHIVRDSTHFIVSGSAAKTEWVKQKGYALYAKDVKGFVELSLHTDGRVSFRVIRVDEQVPAGQEIYAYVAPPVTRRVDSASSDVDFNKDVRVNASEQYKAGKVREFFLGSNYRSAWSQELDVPVFRLGEEKGGLKILQKGGGQQTLSLRLADSTGREYVLRSVEKYPERAIPEVLRGTFAQDLVQDQISASHPYAALIVAPMADSVGLYHTNPRLVFIPDDPRLGEYRETFANTLALFEERPDEDWSDAAWFGNSENIISTRRVLEKLAEDNDNRVDQRFVLRNRLFDLIIGDWDRHDDQWRWATIEKKKTEIYQPIPRDRDQAFFVNEGALAWLWSRRWALPKFEGFDERINWPPGLSFNARHFDRTFLSGLSKDEWIAEATQLRNDFTDQIIESTVRRWPREIFDLHGEDVIRKLKARRDNIVSDALRHYDFLSRQVDVTGSDKRELFKITRLPSGDVDVLVRKISKKGELEQTLYNRRFSPGETKEIRLYGLGGDDQFNVSGSASSRIRIRVIGGEGADVVADSSRRGMSKKVLYYDDLTEGNVAYSVRDLRSDNPQVNSYDRTAFKYDRLAPLLWGQFNPDDKLFVGAGMLYIRHGFRKEPFAQRHLLLASIAPATESYNFRYRGLFIKAIGNLDLDIDADLKSPNYVNNFFGMGNESVYNDDIDDEPGISVDESIDYYRYRFNEVLLHPAISGVVWGKTRIQLGPVFQQVRMQRPDEDEDRFIEEYANTLPFDLFQRTDRFLGVGWSVTSGVPDSIIFPRRGMRLSVAGRSLRSTEDDNGFSSFDGSVSMYYSARERSRAVLAARLGGGTNVGTFPFYQAQILGGRNYVRGYRKTRFYGDSKIYANAELRLRIANFRSYLFPASFGIHAFIDAGRVWYKDENGIDPSTLTGESNRWHYGIGGGVWFTPFNLTVLALEAARSPEGTMAYIRLGFLF